MHLLKGARSRQTRWARPPMHSLAHNLIYQYCCLTMLWQETLTIKGREACLKARTKFQPSLSAQGFEVRFETSQVS